MFDQFNSLRSIFDHARPDLAIYLAPEELSNLDTEISARTKNHQPIVMVYGVYNAGKSTLINALIGKEVAEVGDIPKTDRVDTYHIGDVQILDTPGIDAPIEHEKITREQLNRSDAVIFVLSSDGVLEEKQTYVEIGNILTAKKPMLVVINNKNGYQPSDTAYIKLAEKFRTNLYQHFAGNEEILERLDGVHDYLVNAELALKGKLNDKPKLVEISQIESLEKAVARLFNATNSAQVAKTLAIQVQRLLQKAIGIAQENAGQYELQRLEDLISNLNQSKADLLVKVMANAGKAKAGLKTEIATLLENKQPQATGAVIQHWQQQQTDYFEHQLQRELSKLDAEANEVAQLFINSPENQFDSDAAVQESGDGLFGLFKALSEKSINLGLAKEGVAAKGVVTILKQGKNWFPKLFKGIGPKTMEKMAGRAVPFIGPAIQVVTAVYDYYQAVEQEKRQVRLERQHLEKINHHVDALVEELYDNLHEGVDDALNDILNPISDQLKQNLQDLSQQAGGVEININTLKEAHQQLDKI